MADIINRGALSKEDIQAVWEGATDKSYRDPLVKAGEGGGFEAWTQLFTVLERASQAIDRTTQAMYIAPWSGQTNPSAAGAEKATVTVTLTRTQRTNEPLYLKKGLLVVLENTVDSGETGGVDVHTGRKYLLDDDLYFAPGQMGPFDVPAIAERAGYGYNNPLPGTLNFVEQIGTLFANDLATVTRTNELADLSGVASKSRLVCENQPDMFVPAHLGQYVLITAGLDSSIATRMITFELPTPPLNGSAMELELLWAVGLSPATGTFTKGEAVEIVGGTSTFAFVVDDRDVGGVKRLAFVLENGDEANIDVGSTVTGQLSGATGTIWSIDHSTPLVADAPVGGVGGASWRILDWAFDWGLTVTNVLSPENGVAGFLDELGAEREINRAPGENDDSYAARVKEIGDVVVPNAIKRILNRTIPGITYCLREVGYAPLPGFFFDGTGEPPDTTPHGARNDCWDTDTISFTGASTSGTFDFQEAAVLEDATTFDTYAQGWVGRVDAGPVLTFIRRQGAAPTSLTGTRIRGLHTGAIFTPATATPSPNASPRRWHVWLDYLQMRAFFVVSIQPLSLGEFGFAYDGYSGGFSYDYLGHNAYDGYPWTAAAIYRTVYAAIEATRAGGVSWELRQDGGSCP